jgi:hypothetical protein
MVEFAEKQKIRGPRGSTSPKNGEAPLEKSWQLQVGRVLGLGPWTIFSFDAKLTQHGVRVAQRATQQLPLMGRKLPRR